MKHTYTDVGRKLDEKMSYLNHVKRILDISTRTTDNTKDLIRHQLRINEYQKLKDNNRKFYIKRKFENLLVQNKKLFGNLGSIINSKPVRSKTVESEVTQQQRTFIHSNRTRKRVNTLLEIEKENEMMARKLATAKKSINFNKLEHSYKKTRAYNHHMRRFNNKGSKVEQKATSILQNTGYYSKFGSEKGKSRAASESHCAVSKRSGNFSRINSGSRRRDELEEIAPDIGNRDSVSQSKANSAKPRIRQASEGGPLATPKSEQIPYQISSTNERNRPSNSQRSNKSHSNQYKVKTYHEKHPLPAVQALKKKDAKFSNYEMPEEEGYLNLRDIDLESKIKIN